MHVLQAADACTITYRPSTDDLSLSNSQSIDACLQKVLVVVVMVVVKRGGLCNAFWCGSSICRLEGSCCNLAI
jgi:hypothetical protein